MADYLAEHDEIKAQADELALNFGDTYAALQLLLGLPSSWDGFRQTVETGAADREEELDYDHISDMILQEDVRRAVTRGVKPKATNNKMSNGVEHDQVYSVAEKDAICYRCGYKGHFSFNCKTKPENFKPVVNSSSNNPRPSRYNQPGSSNQQQPRRNSYFQAEAKLATEEVPMDFAGAYTAGKEKRSSKRNGRGKESTVGSRTSPKRTLHLTDVDVALTAGNDQSVEKNRSNPFLIDSGASNHICGNRSFFTDLRPHYAVVSTADKSNPTVEVKEIGSITFTSKIEGKEVTFSLSDVYYIPSFCNLILVGQLLQKQCSVAIGWQGLTLSTQDKGIFARGVIHKKNLFKLDAIPMKWNDEINLVLADKTEVAKLWHRRLGHISESYLTACVTKGAIDGITAKDVADAFAEPCITCIKGKKAREPFPDSDQKATSPLALVHSVGFHVIKLSARAVS